jgi:hypothetical protein
MNETVNGSTSDYVRKVKTEQVNYRLCERMNDGITKLVTGCVCGRVRRRIGD